MPVTDLAQYIIDKFLHQPYKVISVFTYPDRLEAGIRMTDGRLVFVDGLFAAKLKEAQRGGVKC